jgi:hypothetical protein
MFEVTEASATELLLHSDTEISHVSHAFPQVLGHEILVVNFLSNRGDFFLCEFLCTLAERLVHVLELEDLVVEWLRGSEGSHGEWARLGK